MRKTTIEMLRTFQRGLLLAMFGLTALACGDDTETTPAAVCGDGKIEGGEACDDGDENGTSGRCKTDCTGLPAIVSVEGDVLPFLTEVEGARIIGVKVSVLEHPEMTMTTGNDAHFRFDGLEEGSDFTLIVEHADYKPTQTATIVLGPKGVTAFAVQVVPTTLFTTLSALVPLPPEEDKYCVIATTVARMSGSLYVRLRQGLPGVKVALDPPVPEESGPLYFNENVYPDMAQPSTSIDGGVLYYRVPPGDYVMSASKADTVFNHVRFQCRAGMIVNAGPPMGLLANVAEPAYAAGADLPADAYTASTDALCDATQRCVNEKAGAENYPAATLTSCKAMLRDTWAFVDTTCDATSQVRDAARAVFACRTATCEETLGDDGVCAAEEAAFRKAEVAQGKCITAATEP